MAIVTIDFETFYSKEYSLSKMTEIDYILDPRFQTIMCAVKIDNGPSEVIVGYEAIKRKFASIDWTRAAALAHNMRFDGAILAWRFGIYPKMYLCTLSMARALTHAVIGKSSLDAVSNYLGLPPKGKAVHHMLGKRLEDMVPADFDLSNPDSYVCYCSRDNENCYSAFQIFRARLPVSELALIDTILHMFTMPQVRLNSHVLAEYRHELDAQAAACMARVAHIDKSVFSSNQKFAALLEGYGVEVPRKISATTGEETWALAKNDRAFKELCSDEDQPLEVQAVLSARLQTKSTLEQTRAERLFNLSLREWPFAGENLGTLGSIGYGAGWAPVPLKYWGAHTGRLSGDGGFNWQNFKRGSRIREAIEAPDGYRVVHRDASQIEARMVAWLAQCMVLLEAFAQGRDVYSEFASIVYGMLVTKADKMRRFVGKTGILGLGYGCGGPKFRHMLFIGNGGVSVKVEEKEATDIVWKYRRTYKEIPELWTLGGLLLGEIMTLSSGVRPGGSRRRAVSSTINRRFPIIQPGHDCIILPNGTRVAYTNLRYEQSRNANGRIENQMVYDSPYKEPIKIYGAKFTENMSQALARIVVTDIAERMVKLTGYRPFLSTHDSLDYCVPLSEAAWIDQELDRQFAIRPTWAPDLPLASEGGFGRNLMIAESENHAEHNR